MQRLNPSVLLPAHGPPLSAQANLDRYIQHRIWREQKVLAALDDEYRSPSDLVLRVYDDVPTAVYPIAERSLLAHLVKLVAEGHALEQAGSYAAS